MSFGSIFANDLALLIANNTDIATIGDAGGIRGSVAAGSLFASLHTIWPGRAGDQTTQEIAYTGYARGTLARTSGALSVSGGIITTVANLDFPICTAGAATYRFYQLGTVLSAAGKKLCWGAAGSNLGAFTALATDVITIPGLTGVVVNDEIAFFVQPGDTLPTGMAEGTAYFVKTVSGNDITVSTTPGGATLDLTAAGKGVAFRLLPKVIGVNDTPRLLAGTSLQLF